MKVAVTPAASRPAFWHRWRGLIRLVILLGIPLLVLSAVFLVVFVWGQVGRDHDRYARVAIPGEATVNLDAGTIYAYYSEDVSLRASPDTTLIPPNLALTLTPLGGGPELSFEKSSNITVKTVGTQFADGLGTATDLTKLEIPRAGGYRLRVESSDAATRAGPELTLGEDPGLALGERIGDALISWWAAGYVAVALLLALRAHVGGRRLAREAVPTGQGLAPRGPDGVVTEPAGSIGELERLERLRDRGLISEAQFDALRDEIPGQVSL